eukprot:Clim_evm35s239 gene=Clim_evmTU35s239
MTNVKRIQVLGRPMDYTCMDILAFPGMLNEEPRNDDDNLRAPNRQMVKTEVIYNSLRVSGNILEPWTEMTPTLRRIIPDIAQLRWLDLSFNSLSSICSDIKELPGLTHLYLHGSKIKDIVHSQ